MTKIKLVLCVLFVSRSLCGMERAVKRLKVDVLATKYADALAAGTILFQIQEDEPDLFTENTIQDFVSRGISLNKTDKKGNTVLCKAIAKDCYPSTAQKAHIKMLCACGASLQYSLARTMCMRGEKGYYYPRKVDRFCGKLWMSKKESKY